MFPQLMITNTITLSFVILLKTNVIIILAKRQSHTIVTKNFHEWHDLIIYNSLMISCYFTSQAISMEFSSSASDNFKNVLISIIAPIGRMDILDPLFQNYTFFIGAISLTEPEGKMIPFNGRTTNNTIS